MSSMAVESLYRSFIVCDLFLMNILISTCSSLERVKHRHLLCLAAIMEREIISIVCDLKCLHACVSFGTRFSLEFCYNFRLPFLAVIACPLI